MTHICPRWISAARISYFAHVSTPDYAYKLTVDLVAEEQNAESINDAVYLRNTAVEDA